MLGQQIATEENPGFWVQVSHEIEQICILKLNLWDIKNNGTMGNNTLHCSKRKPLALLTVKSE